MMKYFFSESGDYLGGYDEGSLPLVPTGAIEVEHPPAHGKDRLVDGVIVPYTLPLSLLDALKALFTNLDENTQADLGPLAAAVYMYLDQGNPVVAKKVIERATIDPQLEPVRTAMLEKFA